ncbi:hypothetical protein [Bacillus sp. M6-12]|uniref:hypothetical protein n=1 Tax=Bacillus sp. M6-12 TaxID=2054166 RepID=UPI001157E5BC|nr:hypothetical protein [Bacillus sp. M6-12]
MQTLLMNETVDEAPVKKERKYQRIIDQRKTLLELGRKEYLAKTKNMEYDMEMDCIDHFFECEGYKTYEDIATFAKSIGVERVFDIGCAYGHQSETFLKEGLDYIGVTDHTANFWNKDNFQYIINRYPCELPVQKGDLGVSVLCLTWNVYLYENEKTLTEQCEALQRDFEHCLLYIQPDRMEFVSRYFKKVEKVGGGLYYFSNK